MYLFRSSLYFLLFLIYFFNSSILLASEIKLGLLRHDLGIFGNGNSEEGYDINLEYLTPLDIKTAPYLLVGGTANMQGGTDYLYTGFGWRGYFLKRFYAQIDLGVTYHTDRSDKCSILPREAISLGYKINDSFNIESHIDHTSDAWICEPNDAMENAGLRVSYSF